MGVGPFFTSPSSRQTEVLYRGRSASVDFSLALSCWGPLQLELIQPNDDRPSVYREALESANHGLHHVCVYTGDMATARKRVKVAGGEIIHEGKIDGGELLYADMKGGPGTPLLEILRPPLWLIDNFDRITAACASWDGSEPFRAFSSLSDVRT